MRMSSYFFAIQTLPGGHGKIGGSCPHTSWSQKASLTRKARFTCEELDGLLKKLSAYAVTLFAQVGLIGSDVSLRGTGMSPEDLAIETLGKLVRGELNYHRTKGRLDSYLATVMRNDFIDLLRLKAHETSVALDAENGETVGEHPLSAQPDCPPVQLDPFSAVLEREYKEKVFALVKGESGLEEMAYAILEVNAIKPQEIAGVLKTDATDIQNRKKKMRRRLAEFVSRRVD
jgi:DNA-directed RNA polymerase specialized sigma24 family protein